MFVLAVYIVAFIIAADPPTSGEPLIDFILQAGPTGLLALGLFAFFKGWIVPGREVTRVRAERDRALAYMEKQAELTQRAIELSSEKSSGAS